MNISMGHCLNTRLVIGAPHEYFNGTLPKHLTGDWATASTFQRDTASTLEWDQLTA